VKHQLGRLLGGAASTDDEKKVARAIRPQTTTHLGDDASVARRQAKRLATLTARCALAGTTLNPIEDDHGKIAYVVSRLALTRELADLDTVECWLVMVTGSTS